MGDKIVEIGVQTSSKKNSENRHHILVILGFILGTLGLPWGTLWSAIRELFSGLTGSAMKCNEMEMDVLFTLLLVEKV